MPLVKHVQRRYRTQFRRLAFGETFWLASNTATVPFTKLDRNSYIGGWNPSPDGSPIRTTVADTSVAVVRTPGNFQAQNRALS